MGFQIIEERLVLLSGVELLRLVLVDRHFIHQILGGAKRRLHLRPTLLNFLPSFLKLVHLVPHLLSSFFVYYRRSNR